MVIAILKNAALLLAMAFLYDLVVPSRVHERPARARKAVVDVGTGAVLGLIGVAVMASSWELQPGVILDTRSVVLAAVGLFFGGVPVVVAMLVTAAYRLDQGGAGAATGVAVIVATGSIGLIARSVLGQRLDRLRWRELAVVGVATHVVMLTMFVIVPFAGSRDVVRDIAIPVMVVYPLAFVLLGLVLVGRLRAGELGRQVAESESRYRTLFDNGHLVMMVIDPVDGRIIDVNQRAAEFYGWSRADLLRMTASDIEVLPRDEVIRQIDEGLREHRSTFEFQHRLASGEIRDVEVIGGEIRIDGVPQIHAVINDISDRKRAERELVAANEQLLHAQKMEAVGRLAGGIAHDFNNMLQVILGYADLARADAVPGSELDDSLAEIHDAATRSADLTKQLLAFARKQPNSPRVIDVAREITSSARMLRRLVGDDVEVDVEVEGDPDAVWPVRLDPGQLSQVVANLAVNARDAMSDGGRLRIAISNTSVTALTPDDPVEAAVGDYVLVSVSDDGSGIPADMIDSIFEPFFTTRGTDGGTGLGLAIVYGVITQHGGFVDVESEWGAGATFHLYLPRCQSPE